MCANDRPQIFRHRLFSFREFGGIDVLNSLQSGKILSGSDGFPLSDSFKFVPHGERLLQISCLGDLRKKIVELGFIDLRQFALRLQQFRAFDVEFEVHALKNLLRRFIERFWLRILTQ